MKPLQWETLKTYFYELLNVSLGQLGSLSASLWLYFCLFFGNAKSECQMPSALQHPPWISERGRHVLSKQHKASHLFYLSDTLMKPLSCALEDSTGGLHNRHSWSRQTAASQPIRDAFGQWVMEYPTEWSKAPRPASWNWHGHGFVLHWENTRTLTLLVQSSHWTKSNCISWICHPRVPSITYLNISLYEN